MRWDDLQFEQGYDKWAAYAQSKCANVLFARHLDALAASAGTRAFSVSPGYILTPLQRHLATAEMVEAGWIDPQGEPAPGLFRTPEQGAATQVWAATRPELAGAGGRHAVDCALLPRPLGDPAEAARLWQLSAELTGVDAFAG